MNKGEEYRLAFEQYINSPERKAVSDTVAMQIIDKVINENKFLPLPQRLEKIRTEMKNYVFKSMYGFFE